MALNFPSDTSKPYVDPQSGLKYVFNGAVGAWETALQPPVVISDSPPDLLIPGFLWWDSVGGTMYLYYDDGSTQQWVESTPSAIAKQSFVSRSAPLSSDTGDIWWNTLENKLYIKVESEWQDVALRVNEFVADTATDVSFSHTQPTAKKRGDLWYSRTEGKLHIYSDIEGFEGWKSVSPAAQESTIGLRSITTDGTITATIKNGVADIRVKKATSSGEGLMRFASQAEVNDGSTSRAAVTPVALKEALRVIVGERIEAASFDEAMEGELNDKFISPATLSAVVSDGNPVGTVITVLGTSTPTGYILCNGQAVSRSVFSDLFSRIGTEFGIGDGSSTFNVPTLDDNSYIKF